MGFQMNTLVGPGFVPRGLPPPGIGGDPGRVRASQTSPKRIKHGNNGSCRIMRPQEAIAIIALATKQEQLQLRKE